MGRKTLSATSTERVPAPVPAGAHPGQRPTRIAVEAAGDGARFALLDQGHYLAPRPVAGGSGGSGARQLRVALIGIHMMLLAGDDVRIEVSVGPGVTLEVVEPAGMVAYDAEGKQSRWTLEAVLAEGAVMIWEGAPFVAASGSNVLRETRVKLGPGARLLIRETLVLGRSGEEAGPLRSIARLTGPNGDYLYEDLDLRGTRHRAVGVLGTAKVLSSATAAGWRPQALHPNGGARPGDGSARRLDLAAEGAVIRALSGTAHEAARETDPVYRLWKDQLLGEPRPDPARLFVAESAYVHGPIPHPPGSGTPLGTSGPAEVASNPPAGGPAAEGGP
ncbi:urease accessory protein UreD [Arthrobacter sp. zg-Y1110]|uniref:urease accessory protein UreD n=1 Tax=Arthrobacter sp. zg-Y1110 TaxID=2886932 RepID=UPI001D13F1C6|nr:urease accessory protein UreD [Arthrobacter sp. zg-Y1110]MCC3291890.1 urease accessory protein UreD [Arthrobacter sp. zg-Y1110]UWX85718.1 urease accessory protein UreD [Arthrobacter sp. zg-Y1110]